MSPTRRAYALVCGVGVPVLLVAIGTAMTALGRKELPAPLAVHWKSDVVIGSATLTSFLLTTAVQVIAAALLLLGLASRMPHSVRPTLVGTGVGLATFLGLAAYGIVLSQRGLIDSSQAPNPSGSVLGAGLLGVIAGIAVTRGYPAGHVRERSSVPPAAAVRLADPPPAPAFTASSRPATVLLAVWSGGLLITLVLLAAVVQDWWLIVAAVMLAFGIVSSLFPVVKVGPHGLRVSGFGVVPWLGYRIGQIRWAEEVTEDGPAMGLRRSASGWDYRVSPGPVVRVHLVDGSTATFECPRAQACVAVVNTVIEQRAVHGAETADGRLTGAA